MLWLATVPLRPTSGRIGWRWSRPRSWTSRTLRFGVQLLGAAAIVSTVLLVPRSAAAPTTPAGASGLAGAADVLAGLSLLAAGLAALIARPRGSTTRGDARRGRGSRPTGVGWESGAPLLRSLGMVVAPFLPPLLFTSCWRRRADGCLRARPRDPDRSLRRRRGGEHRASAHPGPVSRPILLEQLHGQCLPR